MSLRRIDDEKLCRTYYVEPEYAENDDGHGRRSLIGFTLQTVDVEGSDGRIDRIEGSDTDQYVPRVWELIRSDDALLEALERPLSAFDEVHDSVSHLQRMRELRRRLKIRRALDQDVG